MPYIEINGEEWAQCAACGNIWDGFAQCDCWGYIAYDAEYMAYDDESGYESN